MSNPFIGNTTHSPANDNVNLYHISGTNRSKGKALQIDPNEELICNNCINEELSKAKKEFNAQRSRAAETPMDVQDRLNQMTQNNIKSKVQQRIELSEKVAKAMGRNCSVEKERLIKENERGTFFLNDSALLSNDLNKNRAMEKYNKKQMYSSASMRQMPMKTGVDDYYQKCVDGYVPPKDKPMKSKKYVQQTYNEDLDNQILMNQRLKGRYERKEDNRVKGEMEDDNKKFINQKNEEANRQRKLKEEFLNGNRSLIAFRNAKNKRDKQAEDSLDKNASFLTRQLNEEDRHKKEKDDYKKQMFQRDLDNQIKQKQREKEREREKENGLSMKSSASNGCTCQGMGICSICKKSYPLSFLNPKRNYANLYQRRKSYKP